MKPNLCVRMIFSAILFATISCFPVKGADSNHYVPFEGEKTTWHDDFERYDYVMDEATFELQPFKRSDTEHFGVASPSHGQRRCIVVVPKQPAPGNPWSWRGCYWDHEPQTEVELLRRGFHVAFITPDPGKQWDAWYEFLTRKHGLSRKPAFIGMSKGGVNEYDWTTLNPDKVSCIYADNPAIRPDAFLKLGELARNDVALLNICGSADFLLQHHTLPIEDRYQQLGGRISVMIKEGQPHHPHSLKNPKFIADWIQANLPPAGAAPRDFPPANFTRSYYYTLESTNLWLNEEKTFADCRGPAFFDCYERYDEPTESQWGLIGLSIIAPHTTAPGKPWVFRADAIPRDAAVDQTLLSRGFHIVIAPLTAQSGAVRTQWDNAYRLVTQHGFSSKPVMEGTGTSSGETYAWAIENPDKVSCIYGRNPALKSLMSKTSPLDNLTPLAKAGVPLVHWCDRTDPWFQQQTKIAEDRYKKLGGEITVLLTANAENQASKTDASRVVNIILAHVK